jgi:hypothetical protein
MEGITFTELETGDEAWCGIRLVGDGVVALATSLSSGDEAEVFLSAADAVRLGNMLLTAGS